MPGFTKNAVDYAEDLQDDPRPYFEGRAVGCIACADCP
jgi:FMN reductase